MEYKRIVVCNICKKEIQIRGTMAHDTLYRHIKAEHKIGFFEYYKIK
jgi:hypothetical protein